MKVFEAFGGMDFMITFSLLFVSAIIIVWCLASSFIGPFEHLSCPLFALF